MVIEIRSVVSVGRGIDEMGEREPSGLMEMFYTLFRVVVMWVCVYIKKTNELYCTFNICAFTCMRIIPQYK